MNINRKVERLLKMLIQKTNADEIRWAECDFSNHNDHEAMINGWRLTTEWAQDGKATLWLGNWKIEFYDVRELIEAIHEQYKRLRVGRYSQEALTKKELEQKTAQGANVENEQLVNVAISQFLNEARRGFPCRKRNKKNKRGR